MHVTMLPPLCARINEKAMIVLSLKKTVSGKEAYSVVVLLVCLLPATILEERASSAGMHIADVRLMDGSKSTATEYASLPLTLFSKTRKNLLCSKQRWLRRNRCSSCA